MNTRLEEGVYIKKIHQVTSRILHSIPRESTAYALYNYVMYHVIENTVSITINVTITRQMMSRLNVILLTIKWLSCTLIGCIFLWCGIKVDSVLASIVLHSTMGFICDNSPSLQKSNYRYTKIEKKKEHIKFHTIKKSRRITRPIYKPLGTTMSAYTTVGAMY